MNDRSWIALGGLLASLGVALGALGAHALKTRFDSQQLETYQTAVHYQMLHALGLILIGLMDKRRGGRLLSAAGWLMLLGILLFSGCLFVWLGTGLRSLVYPVPVGGVCFILSWLLLAAGAMASTRSA